MKISILSPDLSHNCLGRAYVLAKILQRRHAVEIAGPILGAGVWPPLAGIRDVPIKSVRPQGTFTSAQALDLRRQLEGDVLYASKPRPTSFGLGLFLKLAGRRPLVLDIDDWEGGFIREDRSARSTHRTLEAWLADAVYDSTVAIGESLPGLADALTVSNSFLRRRFGGTIVWHARDTDAFRPDRYSRRDLRQKYGIPEDERLVMFFGSPGPHKGVEDLVDAVRRVPDPNVTLAIVGIPDETPDGRALRGFALAALGTRFRGYGLQPFEAVPEFLALADVIAIPQRRSSATVGQLPAKVFDAMAMAKPIVATTVSDLPVILHDCGWIVEPSDITGLAGAIREVVADPERASEAGRRARERCVMEYSWDAMEPVLMDVFAPFA